MVLALMSEKPTTKESKAFEKKINESTDDSEESKTVTSAVSEDKHLDKNRGGGGVTESREEQ
jgi:hypothetical protein